jgi:hypothetical protein
MPGMSENTDAFVARLNFTKMEFRGATYLGGDGDDQAVDAENLGGLGGLVVTGTTSSSDLPMKGAGARSSHGGGFRDGFATIVGTELDAIHATSYFGGTGDDTAASVAVDRGTLDIFVAGDTNSIDLPYAAGSAQAENAGDMDVWVARFSVTLSAVRQATYLGWESRDMGYEVAVHPDTSDVYVTGLTWRGMQQDAYVARLDSSLAAGEPPGEATFGLRKGIVKLGRRGWILVLHGTFDGGWEGYEGTGDDIAVFVEGVEVCPTGSRTAKVKRRKVILKDPENRKNKFILKTKKWRFKIVLKDVLEELIDPTDGVEVVVTVLDKRGELLAETHERKQRKLLPIEGTVGGR